MNVSVVDMAEKDLVAGLSASGLCVGRLVGITTCGELLVDYPGNSGAPQRARSIIVLDVAEAADFEQLPVLLFLDSRNSDAPIILGLIGDTVRTKPLEAVSLSHPGREVFVDGKAIQVDADREIVLRCGASSLTLRRDGKIILKGKEIISRASEANKIKGAVVKIN
jgi:hypothetical protein